MHLHKARKQDLEDMVLFALHNIVDDEENVTALALDAAEYYEKSHNDTAYLEALEAKRREVEKSLENLVKVIEKGVVSDTVTERLTQLEEQKSALNDAIGTKNVRASLCEDKHSIQAYFDKFLHADVNDPEIRDQVFEYFVDKVYLYDDKLVVSMWFSEDDKQEITWRDWFSLDEYWTDESPFVKGGSVEFDCFPLSSTNGNMVELPSTCGSSTIFLTALYARLFLNSSLNSLGLPVPRLAFMHCPTKKPMTFWLPSRYCCACSAHAASTSSTIGCRAAVSLTWRIPRSSTIFSGSSPV